MEERERGEKQVDTIFKFQLEPEPQVKVKNDTYFLKRGSSKVNNNKAEGEESRGKGSSATMRMWT